MFSGDDFDGDDTAYKLIAGIRPLDWLGVEAAYVNFGEPEDTVVGTQAGGRRGRHFPFAVGFMANARWMFAKVGLISWDSESREA